MRINRIEVKKNFIAVSTSLLLLTMLTISIRECNARGGHGRSHSSHSGSHGGSHGHSHGSWFNFFNWFGSSKPSTSTSHHSESSYSSSNSVFDNDLPLDTLIYESSRRRHGHYHSSSHTSNSNNNETPNDEHQIDESDELFRQIYNFYDEILGNGTTLTLNNTSDIATELPTIPPHRMLIANGVKRNNVNLIDTFVLTILLICIII